MFRALTLITSLSMVILGLPCAADSATIAVASNFKVTLTALVKDFQQQHPEHSITISSASTSVLFNQIQHGAPFDALLAADDEHPRLLEENGLGVANTRFTYAHGQLALASSQLELNTFDETAIKNILRQPPYKIAMANPALAPYGLASQQSLEYLGLWPSPHEVRATNVVQSFQFVSTGSASLGFVSLASIYQYQHQNNNTEPMHYWLIPTHWYQAIRQQAILLQFGHNNQAVIDFLHFLHSNTAAKLTQQHGYLLDSRN